MSRFRLKNKRTKKHVLGSREPEHNSPITSDRITEDKMVMEKSRYIIDEISKSIDKKIRITD